MPTIAVRRLYAQQLLDSSSNTPAGVLAYMGAIQGQDYPASKWAIGLRLPGSTETEIEDAIVRREVLRTWALRGTLQLVAATDIRWLVRLVGPRIIAGNARRYRELELDEQTLNRSNDVLVRALEGGKQIGRRALYTILERNGISTRGQRGVFMLQRASLEGLVCQGVVVGGDPTYMRMDESVPDDARTRDECLADLARSYFTSRGPATIQDFIWWSGLIAAEARSALDMVKSRLASETAEGVAHWFSPHAPIGRQPGSVVLLPVYDEFLIGYRDRSASVDPPALRSVSAQTDVMTPTVLDRGRVIGIWKRAAGSRVDSIRLQVTPLCPLSPKQQRGLQSAILRYAKFLGKPVKSVSLPSPEKGAAS